MAKSLITTLDIDELTVTIHPVIVDRLYSGFAGSDGLVSMNLGKRGRMITIQGRAKSNTYHNYNSARTDLLNKIYALESLTSESAADYYYRNDTIRNMIFERLELLPSYGNQYYVQDSKGYLSCKFIYYCRSLSDA